MVYRLGVDSGKINLHITIVGHWKLLCESADNFVVKVIGSQFKEEIMRPQIGKMGLKRR